MEYKRLEIYVGWTCNQKCTYCMEYENMEKAWNKKVTKYDILKKLIKYKKLGYNHVTYLGGEPFIQEIFYDALKIGKKLGYTILVTTNASTIHIENQAKKYFPFIDHLFLSVQAIDKDLQQKISRSKVYVKWEEVFNNIEKYWNGSMLKVNIVITKDNLNEIYNIVKYVVDKGVKNISITYPDLNLGYYGKNYILDKVAPTYYECIKTLLPIIKFCNNINLKLPDFPFCVFPKNNILEYIKLTDDYDYDVRIKIDHLDNILDRGNIESIDDIPRERYYVDKCKKCIYKGMCWGPSVHYKKLYGLDEINPIK